MNLFLTGASGFVGGAVARKLSKEHSIMAMARNENSAAKIQPLGVKPVICDLNNVEALHLKGCEVVVHCAAYAEEWGSEEDFFQANVQGTKNLLHAAKKAGAKRFIFIGTEAGLFHGQDMLEIDESYPYADNSPYPYSRTKAQAEQLVLAANAADFTTISIRPRMVWGPNDQSILPAILQMIEKGQFAWIQNGDFKTSNTHIDNLVHAVSLALTKGVGGQAYFVANDGEVQIKEFLGRYIATQGVQAPNKSIPKPVARFAAQGLECVWKIFGIKKKPPLVRFSIDIMSAHCTLKTDKARRDLGYAPIISTEDGLKTMPKLKV